MKTDTVQIVDRGRGPQLSGSRVTVQDLVPYFQTGSSHADIVRDIPTLTEAEIAVAELYYRQHQSALDEEERRLGEQNGGNKNPAWVDKLLEEARAERVQLAERLRRQANGEAS